MAVIDHTKALSLIGHTVRFKPTAVSDPDPEFLEFQCCVLGLISDVFSNPTPCLILSGKPTLESMDSWFEFPWEHIESYQIIS